MTDFEELTGGNSNQVRRKGNTVIRQCGVWSPFVHQLLQFLEASGFEYAPIFIETDGTTETLSYIEGEVGNEPLKPDMLSDAILVEAAQLLRKFHDLTEKFIVPADAQFMLPLQNAMKREVICHNDFAPYNCVFREGHIAGIIDFDTAAPGERIQDIAYAVYRFVPLASDSHCIDAGWKSPPDRLARLQKFCDAYGLEDRSKLIDTVIHRIKSLMDYMQSTESNLEHIPIYEADIVYIQAEKQTFESVLCD